MTVPFTFLIIKRRRGFAPALLGTDLVTQRDGTSNRMKVFLIRNGVSTAFATVNDALTGWPMRVTFLTPRPVTEDRSKGRMPKTEQKRIKTLA